MIQSQSVNLRVLIADDDSDDHYFIREAIKQEQSNAHVASVYNGQELIDYLLRRGKHEGCTDELPHFVLLDINMPKINGLEALTELRKHSLLKTIRFFILSTSQASEDIRNSFALDVDGFYTKPNTMQRLKLIVKQILWRYPNLPIK
jgi:CheY-like chemotaxis protein